MKALLAAVAIWTAVAVIVVLYVPTGSGVLPCMKLVARSAACEADQAALNNSYFFHHTLPLVVAGLTGYVAVAVLWLSRHPLRGADGGHTG